MAHAVRSVCSRLDQVAIGGVIFNQLEMQEAMRHLTEDMRVPLAVHPGAAFLGATSVPMEVSAYEACWSLAFSYYSVTKSHISIMGAQRINKAGASSLHTTLKGVFEGSVVEVVNTEWMTHLNIGSDVEGDSAFLRVQRANPCHV